MMREGEGTAQKRRAGGGGSGGGGGGGGGGEVAAAEAGQARLSLGFSAKDE
jgi:hypothetical protein